MRKNEFVVTLDWMIRQRSIAPLNKGIFTKASSSFMILTCLSSLEATKSRFVVLYFCLAQEVEVVEVAMMQIDVIGVMYQIPINVLIDSFEWIGQNRVASKDGTSWTKVKHRQLNDRCSF